MPYRMIVSLDHRIVFSRVEGAVGLPEIEAFREELGKHPDFDESFDQLADLTRARSAPSYEELRRIAQRDPFSAASRRAIIVPDDVHFGTYRAYDSLLGDDRATVRPFRTLEEACEWIGVSVTEARTYLDEKQSRSAG